MAGDVEVESVVDCHRKPEGLVVAPAPAPALAAEGGDEEEEEGAGAAEQPEGVTRNGAAVARARAIREGRAKVAAERAAATAKAATAKATLAKATAAAESLCSPQSRKRRASPADEIARDQEVRTPWLAAYPQLSRNLLLPTLAWAHVCVHTHARSHSSPSPVPPTRRGVSGLVHPPTTPTNHAHCVPPTASRPLRPARRTELAVRRRLRAAAVLGAPLGRPSRRHRERAWRRPRVDKTLRSQCSPPARNRPATSPPARNPATPDRPTPSGGLTGRVNFRCCHCCPRPFTTCHSLPPPSAPWPGCDATPVRYAKRVKRARLANRAREVRLHG